MADSHPLDNPAKWALLGPQAHLAERRGGALRYPADVSPFVALPDEPHPGDWADLADLVGPAGVAATAGVAADPPPGWEILMRIEGVQMVADQAIGAAVTNRVTTNGSSDELLELGPAQVPEMLDLVARTRPGPFRRRTVDLGGYLRIRRGGRLIGMAGQRLRPPGWTEVSGVCTDADFRGQGLATRLTLAVVAVIRARGDTPFLHASADNMTAIRLYESLGFRFRRHATFVVARCAVPAASSAAATRPLPATTHLPGTAPTRDPADSIRAAGSGGLAAGGLAAAPLIVSRGGPR
ncbi:MAG TPA: GNAT family N-acetyltransferase [Streptosporangiaceae bacterium]